MSRLTRWANRVLILLIAAATIWLIVTQIFDRIDQRLPLFVALLVTYLLAAYVVLPLAVRAAVTLTRRNRIPRVTRAGDGLAADPVNIVLTGSLDELAAAFSAAGWSLADPLTVRTGWRMIVAFLANRAYPSAPFSPLYLFGRRQDIGFEEDVGNSPRKRHHVRFWAADVDPGAAALAAADWTMRRRIDPARAHFWVGAGTSDLGFGLQSMTFQISHRVDRHADPERDHIIGALRGVGRIADERFIDASMPVGTHFISDGRIVHARLLL